MRSSFRSAAADTPREADVGRGAVSTPDHDGRVAQAAQPQRRLDAGGLGRGGRERGQVDGDAERVRRKDAGDDRPARGRDHEHDLRAGPRRGQPAEHVPNVDRRPAARAGAVPGQQELVLRHDLVQPGRHRYTPSGHVDGRVVPRCARGSASSAQRSVAGVTSTPPRPPMKLRTARALRQLERLDVGTERPERAEPGRPVDHGDVRHACEHRSELRRRERTERVHADEQEIVVVGEQLLRRVADRPDRDQRGARAGVAGDLERADLLASELRSELRRNVCDHGPCLVERRRDVALEPEVVVRLRQRGVTRGGVPGRAANRPAGRAPAGTRRPLPAQGCRAPRRCARAGSPRRRPAQAT